MTETQREQTVQDLIAALVASWPEGYAGVRAVLEELVEALPVQGPHPARMAARDYIARHCQFCGAPVSRITDDLVDDLGALRAGVADVGEVQGGDQEVLCSACYVVLVEGDDATWLAELRFAQHERPLGLFGRVAHQAMIEGWPSDSVMETFGALPDLERYPQGTYEQRDSFDG